MGVLGVTVTIPVNPEETSTNPVISKNINVVANSTVPVEIVNVPLQYKYIQIGVHTQKKNLTLSKTSSWSYVGNSISGTNTGLILLLESTETSGNVWIINQNAEDVKTLLTVILKLDNAPIPGGCNMEFPVEISPFLEVFYNRINSRIEYQHANTGYLRNMTPPLCDSSMNFLSYDVYVYFLEENDFGESEYFKSLSVMTNISSIYSRATKISPVPVNPKTRVSFMSYPGQGVIYNVIASYEKFGEVSEAAYVPAATYGCSFASKVDGCGHLNSIFAKALMGVCAVFGLALTLFGHRLFKTAIFFFGFLTFSLVSFILLTRYGEMDTLLRNSLTVACGVVGGGMCVMFWCFLGIYPISVLPLGFVFGFLLMSIIYFTPIGETDILRNDVNYWLILACGVLLVTIISLPYPKALTILSSSIIGSYIIAVMVDRYIHTTLSYIVLNVVKHAVVDDLYLASNAFPFQLKDIILASSWGAFALFGICIQTMMQKGKPSIPEPPCANRKTRRYQREYHHVQNAPSFNQLENNERRPLLFDQDRNHSRYNSTANPTV